MWFSHFVVIPDEICVKEDDYELVNKNPIGKSLQ
jgi:hypothetical protein